MVATKSLDIIKNNPKKSKPERARPYPPVFKFIQFGFQTLGRLFPKQAGQLAYKFFTTPLRRARHAISDEILESARLFEFLYGKQILKGYEWGQGEKTVLLVHGWESRGTGLRSFVPELVAAGFRVVAFDGPAHGNSDGKRTNLPHFAGAIRAIMNQVGDVYGIITHSFGGASTAYALGYLENTHQINKLVFIAVPGKLKSVFEKTARIMRLPRKAAQEFERILQSKVNNRPLEMIDVATGYKNLNVKDVLVVHDKKDPVVPFRSAVKIYENWDNATMIVTDGMGHYRIMKDSLVVKKIVEFIND